MSNLHFLYEYKFAKEVVEQIPKINKVLDNTLEQLYPHRDNIDVVSIIWAIHESRIFLDEKYNYYKKIYENKAETKGRS